MRDNVRYCPRATGWHEIKIYSAEHSSTAILFRFKKSMETVLYALEHYRVETCADLEDVYESGMM